MAEFGTLDATFQACGGEQGLRALVDTFYDTMRDEEAFQPLWDMHPSVEGDPNKEQSRDKLARFLCGWTGGPRVFQEEYGEISIPRVHMHLKVGETERDMWLGCMRQALIRQGFDQTLSDYLLEQLAKPAEIVRRMSQG